MRTEHVEKQRALELLKRFDKSYLKHFNHTKTTTLTPQWHDNNHFNHSIKTVEDKSLES
jgi:hypothetical protein